KPVCYSQRTNTNMINAARLVKHFFQSASPRMSLNWASLTHEATHEGCLRASQRSFFLRALLGRAPLQALAIFNSTSLAPEGLSRITMQGISLSHRVKTRCFLSNALRSRFVRPVRAASSF